MNMNYSNLELYMQRCIELAQLGKGKVAPNPMVGALLVKEDQIIGEGFHAFFGGDHAEVVAFKNAEDKKNNIRAATLFCTLEPCCHYPKKTPPCVDKIIEKRPALVVIGCLDPNPQVQGLGVKKLKEAGIEVVVGVLENDCQKLINAYIKHIQTKTPFVTLKLAQTLDGKMATYNGDSQWISSEESRQKVQELRYQHDAILVGSGTVHKDNPRLTVRLPDLKKDIFRIVAGSLESLNTDATLFTDEKRQKTIVAYAQKYHLTIGENKVRQQLIKQGVHLLAVPSFNEEKGRVDLLELLKELGKMQIQSILVEGGQELASSFLQQQLVDEVKIFIAPKIMGQGKDIFTHTNQIEKISDCINFADLSVESIGVDILFSGRPMRKPAVKTQVEEDLCLQA